MQKIENGTKVVYNGSIEAAQGNVYTVVGFHENPYYDEGDRGYILEGPYEHPLNSLSNAHLRSLTPVEEN